MSTHNIYKGTIYIPPTCFGDYIAVIRECKTPSYLQHVKTWQKYSRKISYIIVMPAARIIWC